MQTAAISSLLSQPGFCAAKAKPNKPKHELSELLFFSLPHRRRKLLAARDVQTSHFANGAMKLIRRERVVA